MIKCSGVNECHNLGPMKQPSVRNVEMYGGYKPIQSNLTTGGDRVQMKIVLFKDQNSTKYLVVCKICHPLITSICGGMRPLFPPGIEYDWMLNWI